MKILHIGIPCTKPMPGETYYEPYKEFYTNPDDHPFKLEFFRYPDGCDVLPEPVVKEFHVAIQVDSVEETLKEMDEIVMPIQRIGEMVFAMAKKDGVLFEIRQ